MALCRADGSGERAPAEGKWIALALVLIVVIAVLERSFEWARELGTLLHYGGLVGVSIVSDWWLPIGLVDVLLAALWLVSAFHPLPCRRCTNVVDFSNRQLGHLQAALSVITLVTVALPLLPAVPPYVTSSLQLVPLSLVAWVVLRLAGDSLAKRLESADHLNWARRPIFYATAFLAWALLLSQSYPDEIEPLKRIVAVTWFAMLLRSARWALGLSHDRGIRERMRAAAPTPCSDKVIVAALVPVMLLPFAPLAVDQWRAVQADRAAENVHCAGSGGSDAVVGSASPVRAEIALFLVADNQFHMLGGRRNAGHLRLVDRAVPVAVRPVELDVLSGVSLARFAALFQAIGAERAKAGLPAPWWAHLGDSADLGCVSELDRFASYVARFPPDTLAGLAPGNHDSTYIGNFAWHPDWAKACEPEVENSAASGRLVKMRFEDGQPMGLDARLKELAEDRLPPSAPDPVLVSHPLSEWTGVHQDALVSVAPLGKIGGREVVVAFLDTSDYTSFELGIAGIRGAISSEQAHTVEDLLQPHAEAVVVLAMHHPYLELSWISRRRFDHVVRGVEANGGRVAAIVSAHTHATLLRTDTIAGRAVPELIIGSTTDGPQEAALLEMGPDASGALSARFRSLPLVSRPGQTCEDVTSPLPQQWTIDAETCRQHFDALGSQGGPPACGRLMAARADGFSTPKQLKDEQADRAADLFSCLGLGAIDDPTKAMPDDRIYPRIDDRAWAATQQVDGAEATRLACLAWAAGAFEIFKGEKRPDGEPVDFGTAADWSLQPFEPEHSSRTLRPAREISFGLLR